MDAARAPQGLSPTELFRERILCCFIADRIGVKLLDEFNVDNVCWESDYPHSDSSWPHAPERLAELFAGFEPATSLPESRTETRCGTSSSTPSHCAPPDRCTAGALRREAGDVDTVTRAGRPADERDLATWQRLTRR